MGQQAAMRVPGVDFFRALPKTRVESPIGNTWTPNLYYVAAVARLVIVPGLDHLHSYVLSLPVSTEIAEVRGHDGYGFPKWVTSIDVGITQDDVSARVANDRGETDLEIAAPTPPQQGFRPLRRVSTLTSYTRIGGNWHSTLNQAHVLATGRRLLPRGVNLRLGKGRPSDDVGSVAPKRVLALDGTTSAQIALHMSVPISTDTAARRGRWQPA